MPNSTLARISTLLFDWDGTLADSAPLGLAAFRKTFTDLGVSFSEEIYQATYSPNWYLIYEALGLPRTSWSHADDLWNKHYGEQTAELVEGAHAVIIGLQRQGYRLGVVTSGTASRVYREIEHAGLTASFDVVVCNEQIVNQKPDPEGLEIAFRRLSCSHQECVYVGDAPEDIEMGKRANILTIGVRSSYPSSTRLLAAGPDIYLDSLKQLPRHFSGVRSNVH
jgi:HAD superfamily hydrolase (TIGR01549 family)